MLIYQYLFLTRHFRRYKNLKEFTSMILGGVIKSIFWGLVDAVSKILLFVFHESKKISG